MSEILQILPFKEVIGEVLACDIQDFGGHSIIILTIKTAKKEVFKFLLGDLAIHLLPGGLANIKGKMVIIRQDPSPHHLPLTIIN